MDLNIVKKFITGYHLNSKYPQYFLPEMKPFLNEILPPKTQPDENEYEYYSDSSDNDPVFKYNDEMANEINDEFYAKRILGENDTYICKLIQNDSIEEFIIFVNKNFISLNSIVKPSIYETNPFLLKNKKITLIEYAAFFGSNQIFNYLRLNDAEIKPSIWNYAVHGQNAEIIHILEQQINSNDEIYEKCFMESIICNNVDVSNYIYDNYLMPKDFKLSKYSIIYFKNYNFVFIQHEFINKFMFYYLCKYDYFMLVEFLLKNTDIDINKQNILFIK